MHLSSPAASHAASIVCPDNLRLGVRRVLQHVVVKETDRLIAVDTSIGRGDEMLPLDPLSVFGQQGLQREAGREGSREGQQRGGER
jgi:hypothetical protein